MPRKTTSGPACIPGLFPFMGRRQRGFTQVELIVVIIMAGILAAVAMPRWRGESGFEERQFRDELVAALRYAQKSAIAARRTVCATFSATSATFSIAPPPYNAASCVGGSALVGPDGQALVVGATGSAGFPAVPADVIFDSAGRPTTGGVTLSFTGLPAGLDVTVEAETGYVR